MSIREKLDRAQEICGHQFNDISLLRSAVTHPSAVEGEPVSASYERLEFLGDSILGAVVAVSLFQTYTDFDEGKLTRLKVSLVSGTTLSDVGLELGIDKVIILGASEQGTGARGMHSALENVYEALVGALYLDGGWSVAETFIMRTLKPHLATERAEHPTNPKSFLQECVQSDHMETRLIRLLEKRGPRMSPRSPQSPWSMVSVVAAAPVPRRKKRKLPQPSMRLIAWDTPQMALSSRRSSDSEAPCTLSRSPSRVSNRLPIALR